MEEKEIADIVVSPEMDKFFQKLIEIKPELEKLDPIKRNHRIKEIRYRILPEKEIKRLIAPVLKPSEEFLARRQKLLDRYKIMKPTLEKLSYRDRSTEMAYIKKIIMKE
jgi:hypothetical protein